MTTRERCGGKPGEPKWRQTSSTNRARVAWHDHGADCGMFNPPCYSCPGCHSCRPDLWCEHDRELCQGSPEYKHRVRSDKFHCIHFPGPRSGWKDHHLDGSACVPAAPEAEKCKVCGGSGRLYPDAFTRGQITKGMFNADQQSVLEAGEPCPACSAPQPEPQAETMTREELKSLLHYSCYYDPKTGRKSCHACRIVRTALAALDNRDTWVREATKADLARRDALDRAEKAEGALQILSRAHNAMFGVWSEADQALENLK